MLMPDHLHREIIESEYKNVKVFVTGVGGQLGHDVMNELAKRGHEGIGSDIAPVYSGIQDGSEVTKLPYVSMDITNREQVDKVISEINPDVIVHCAAWTAVDLAEDEDKKAKVKAINVDGVQNIADVAKKLDAKMIYISTDYVFNGQGTEPWKPDCKDYAPLNYYGETKLGGELAVSKTLEKYFIVRIAWVFGLNGKNFIKTMLNVGKTHDTVRVVNDQIGTPTYTLDLSVLLVDMLETEKYGYYHATNEGGYISWYDFTKEIYKQAGLATEVIPVTTEEYGLSKAARPFNSRLDKSKLVENGFKPLPTWQDALSRYLEALKDIEI
ncbi:dTDP-4-dehydrorhamnose reductase [Oribacterium sp. KHPX15]|nr:dTDP-4-dehydrorhamnose reductase [Oribacterium sp. KHPX15]